MPKIALTGAAFHGFKFTIGPKRGQGAPIIIAEFTAPWTEKNRKAGGWDDLPLTVSGSIALVPADLAASHVEFIPGKGMEKHAFSLDVSGATHFQCFCPTKEDEVRELRFNVETPHDKAGRILDTYGRTCGDATGKLTISYAEQTQVEVVTTEERTSIGEPAEG